MNIVNIAIIVFILLTLAVIIFVIMKSLKSVDENIIEELKSDKIVKQKSIFRKIKEGIVYLFEVVVKKINQITQKLYSWIVKIKRREKNEIIKAKEELIIKDDISANEQEGIDGTVKSVDDKVDKEDSQGGEIDNGKEDDVIGGIDESDKGDQALDKYFNDNDKKSSGDKDADASAESYLSEVSDRTKDSSKKRGGFVKKIFKKRKKTKQMLDVKEDKSEEWTLGGSDALEENDDDTKKERPQAKKVDITPVGNKFKESTSSIDSGVKKPSEDDMLGVDREILEKKILQKIDKNPKNMDNYKELGNLYIKMEKLDDALEVFTYVLSVKPRDVEALNKQSKIKLLKKVQRQ